MADSLVTNLATKVGKLSPSSGKFYYSENGVDYQVTAQQIVDAAIPTAQELSQGTAFSDYVQSQITNKKGAGPILLPPGDIVLPQQWVFNLKNGAHFLGAGGSYVPYGSDASWNTSTAFRGTRIVFQGSPATAAVSLSSLQFCRFQGIHFEHTNGGTAIEYVGTSAYNVFDQCSFTGLVGLDAGINNGPILCSDLSFRTCMFRGCDIGFRCNNPQNVVYTFSDTTYFLEGRIGVHAKQGGGIRMFGCATNVISECVLKVGPETAPHSGGGGNTGPNVIVGLKIDRSYNAVFQNYCPRIIDALYAAGNVISDVRGVVITIRGDDKEDADDVSFVNDWTGLTLFRSPSIGTQFMRLEASSIYGPYGVITTAA